MYIETPDEREGFHNATCWLPYYVWEDVVGYSEEKSDKDTKVKNTVVDNTEENTDTDLRENTETEKYLIKKLKEIRETRNNK